MKKLITLFITMIFLFAGCGSDNQIVIETTIDESTAPTINESQMVILYTNDIHGAYQRDDAQGRLGFAALAAYAGALEDAGKSVVLIDGGDAIQGEIGAAFSKGSYIIDLMNEAGYLMSIPGDHEFDFGIDIFLELANKQVDFSYVSCNFTDLKTGEPVFPPYALKDFGGKLVAFVGISTPEIYTKVGAANFRDAAEHDLYGFCEGNDGQALYDRVQQTIDDAVKEGADYVIGVGHLGTDPDSSPWTSVEVIANTTGFSVFLDAHSHSLIEGQSVKDKDDNDVILCSAGSKFNSIGEITLDLNTGITAARLITEISEDDEDVLKLTQDITGQIEDILDEVVAVSEVDLITHDPGTEERLICRHETNLGDFCADAYRTVLGADVALINGGAIRAEIEAGDVTYRQLLAVHPLGGDTCVIETSGQEILDALELSISQMGIDENEGFLHISGLTMEVHTYIESSVKLDDKDQFLQVTGPRRVRNVMIGGEPLEPEKSYTVASNDYLLLGGEGYAMFADNRVLKREVMPDNQVLITYVQQYLEGTVSAEQYAKPQGRITVVEAQPME